MKNEKLLEYGLITATMVVLSFVFFRDDNLTFKPKEQTYEEFIAFPLSAWSSIDKQGGECVKVKYLVEKNKTKLYMLDRYNKVVHSQPLALNPYKDGRERIETYVWRLYRTEWTDRIGPGAYQIVVGTQHQIKGLSVEINLK